MFPMRVIVPIATLVCLLSFGGATALCAASDDAPDFASGTLSGDWGGLRGDLWQRGWEVGFTYKADAWRNLSGGLETGGRALDNIDVTLAFDGGRGFGSPGFSGFIHLLGNDNGRGPNELVGSNGGIDNIEVETPAYKLYQAWIAQDFGEGRVSLLFGLHDFNSEFYVTDTSGLFLNPTDGIGTELAATGKNGPSIFPYTGLAFRVALQSEEGGYLMAAAYDGVPGDPARPRGTHLSLRSGDGALLVAEGGVRGGAYGHLGAGIWRYTEARPDLVSGEPAHSRGFYFLMDQRAYESGDRRVSAFARVGFTAGDVDPFTSSWNAGVVLEGFVPWRESGQLGLAVSQARNASAFVQVNGPLTDSETQAELTYLDALRPGISIQPDLQFTVHPGADPTLARAWTAGVRLTLEF